MTALPQTPPRASRKDRERQRKREDLLLAAEEVFAEKGFHDGSMEEIAKRAEYAPAALYRYFSGKEVLYAAVLEAKLNEFLTFLKQRASSILDPVAALRMTVHAGLEFASTHGAFFQIYYRERMETTHSGKHWEAIGRLTQQVLEWHAARVEIGQQTGVFREGDPYLYALALDGLMQSVVRHRLSKGTNQSTEDDADFVIELALSGIRKPAQVEPAKRVAARSVRPRN